MFFIIPTGLFESLSLWSKRRKCPKCGAKNTLQFHSEVVTDRVVGHSKQRIGGGGGRGKNLFGGLYTSYTQDHPFIREWVQERYICKNCGRHVAINTKRDKR